MWVSIFVFVAIVSGCETDVDCRSQTQCNAKCDIEKGQCVVPFLPVVCLPTTVCYEKEGFCYDKCVIDSDCISLGKGRVCDQKTGKCLKCLADVDCFPQLSRSCGARCIYNEREKDGDCTKGIVCNAAGPWCEIDESKNFTYTCSGWKVPSSSSFVTSNLFVLSVLIYCVF